MSELPPELSSIPRRRFEHKLADSRQAKADLKKLAAILRRAREQAGYTIKSLAKKVGCSHQQISHVENEDNYPTLPVFFKLCRVLNLGEPPLV